jgi:hypothetical protein
VGRAPPPAHRHWIDVTSAAEAGSNSLEFAAQLKLCPPEI